MDNDKFLKRAKKCVADSVVELVEEDLYIVWFCKTLQNWESSNFNRCY